MGGGGKEGQGMGEGERRAGRRRKDVRVERAGHGRVLGVGGAWSRERMSGRWTQGSTDGVEGDKRVEGRRKGGGWLSGQRER